MPVTRILSDSLPLVLRILAVGAILILVPVYVHAQPQTTSFTYQGRLTDGGNPANGNFDLQFALFDNATGGAQIGSTLARSSVAVSAGIFSVQLDFGVSAFPGANRFLEISVRPSIGGSFAILSPRQQINSTPYAIRTLSAQTADTATNAAQLGGVAASQYVQTNDSRLSDARPPTAGSSNYIQNTTPGAGTNFNISGNGTALGTLSGNIVNATTQFNLGGQRILNNAGTSNLFAGVNAGGANTTGCCSTFFGFNAGAVSNVNDNSFFGNSAGTATTTGGRNSFFGSAAGLSNVSGVGNSFFGVSAGRNTTGSSNSFFGDSAGQSSASGSSNSFFGANAGQSNNIASNNSFFGSLTGQNNIGSENSFFGVNAGSINSGQGNSFFGYQAGLYHTSGAVNNFFGFTAGRGDEINGSTGQQNNFFGQAAGFRVSTGSLNSLFGDSVGLFLTTGSSNTFIGANAGNPNISTQVSNSTAIGYNATVGCDHCIVLGDASDSDLRVGIGKTNPGFSVKLDVQAGDRIGVHATSTANPGVLGDSQSNFGVSGNSASNQGVHGLGYFGVFGYGQGGTNGTVYPFSTTGVVGQSGSGIGVVAVSGTGYLMAGVSGDAPSNYVEKFHILNNGTYVSGSDFAEALPARDDKATYEPGDVLVLSSKVPGTVEKASRPYDERVAGVYSTRPGMLGADKQGATRVDADDLPVAIVGVVPTKVSAENGAIQVGDLLTTASTPGHAMRCADRLKCLGASLGKAMESLANGKGTIKVLVTLR